MQKILYLIRHAKSDWENPLLRDFDRPLSERGLRIAPQMANLLYQVLRNVLFALPLILLRNLGAKQKIFFWKRLFMKHL
jgi:phosphohistidine phosphatase SixA